MKRIGRGEGLPKKKNGSQNAIYRKVSTMSVPIQELIPSDEKIQLENDAALGKALGFLQQVVDDSMTPKNIRKIVMDTINALNDKSSIGIRAANSLSILEELSQDPNMPSSTRVAIWSAVSSLASIREI